MKIYRSDYFFPVRSLPHKNMDLKICELKTGKTILRCAQDLGCTFLGCFKLQPDGILIENLGQLCYAKFQEWNRLELLIYPFYYNVVSWIIWSYLLVLSIRSKFQYSQQWNVIENTFITFIFKIIFLIIKIMQFDTSHVTCQK